MKTLKEYQGSKLVLSSTELVFSRIKDLHSKKLDFDVYLPSIDMNLQRPLVWSHLQKSELVLSVFSERYIPYISVMSIVDNEDSLSDILQIIDGKQRLSTLIEFYNNKFPITIDYNQYYYKDLPEDYQMCYKYYNIRAQIAYEDFHKPFTDLEKISWFDKINFSGTPQDIEHLENLKKPIV